MPARPAFTLIELLVVVSIVALLVGLLLPALASAREAGRSISCLSNNRQMAIATVNYALEHDGILPSVGFSHGGATLPEQGSWFFTLQRFSGGTLAWRCPSDDSPAWETPEGSPPRLRRVSYATNYMLSGLISSPRYRPFVDLNKVPAPSATIFLGELAEQSPTGFATADHFHPETWFDEPARHDEVLGRQLEIQQHSGKSNFAFLDGHASTEARSEVFEVAPGATIFNPRFAANHFWPDVAR